MRTLTIPRPLSMPADRLDVRRRHLLDELRTRSAVDGSPAHADVSVTEVDLAPAGPGAHRPRIVLGSRRGIAVVFAMTVSLIAALVGTVLHAGSDPIEGELRLPVEGAYTYEGESASSLGSTGRLPAPSSFRSITRVQVKGRTVTQLREGHVYRYVIGERGLSLQEHDGPVLDFKPDTPLLELRWPTEVGASWTQRITSSAPGSIVRSPVHIVARIRVVGEDRLEVAGRSWRVVVIDSRLTYSGGLVGWEQNRVWFSPELGVQLRVDYADEIWLSAIGTPGSSGPRPPTIKERGSFRLTVMPPAAIHRAV